MIKAAIRIVYIALLFVGALTATHARASSSAELCPAEPVATATLVAAPGDTSCSAPFADVGLPDARTIQWPLDLSISERTSTVLKVVIDANGALEEASVYQTSSSQLFDDAAIAPIEQWKYRPAISFCKPVPTVNLFQIDFAQGGGR